MQLLATQKTCIILAFVERVNLVWHKHVAVACGLIKNCGTLNVPVREQSARARMEYLMRFSCGKWRGSTFLISTKNKKKLMEINNNLCTFRWQATPRTTTNGATQNIFRIKQVRSVAWPNEFRCKADGCCTATLNMHHCTPRGASER